MCEFVKFELMIWYIVYCTTHHNITYLINIILKTIKHINTHTTDNQKSYWNEITFGKQHDVMLQSLMLIRNLYSYHVQHTRQIKCLENDFSFAMIFVSRISHLILNIGLCWFSNSTFNKWNRVFTLWNQWNCYFSADDT